MHGHAEQRYARLAEEQPKLRLVRLGCPGESTASIRYGTQAPTDALSCATPRGYKDIYPRGTELAEPVRFRGGHSGKITIDVGGDNLQHFDVQLLADTHAASGVPVADVAGAFQSNDLVSAADNVCVWTWFCSLGDFHPNTTGSGVIARASNASGSMPTRRSSAGGDS